MTTAIFHSVNAGLYFWNGGKGVLVDGIHRGIEEGLSMMPEFLVGQLHQRAGLFAHLDMLLFTHLHPDHYDPQLTAQLRRNQPQLPVFGPALQQGEVLVRPIRSGLRQAHSNGICLLAEDTEHDGAIFQGTPHQSYLLNLNGEIFFIAGDATLSPSDAEDLRGFYGSYVAGAFLNLYQIASPEGQSFLRYLAPERVFLYHLPFPDDDSCHYHQLARQAIKHYPADLPPVERLAHMSWLDGRMAEWGEPYSHTRPVLQSRG